MSLLEVKDLHKDFSGLKVLTGINLSIEEEERHSIIGPNGAGKSTLFNIITGKYRPSLGRIFFDGEDITGLSPYKISRRGLARSFQIINIFPMMNVYQNVRNAILSKEKIRLNIFFRLEKMDRIDQETINVLESLGLIGIKDVLAGELSYGQQRALEIGIALATDPKLILLDEPTAGMTKEETKETVALIQNVTKGKTLVVIEHDMDVVFSIAHRITVLYYGEILASGTPDEIRNSEKVKEAYLGKKADARSF
jgi:branched-chain amino acid transport system ATP-binding protein